MNSASHFLVICRVNNSLNTHTQTELHKSSGVVSVTCVLTCISVCCMFILVVVVVVVVVVQFQLKNRKWYRAETLHTSTMTGRAVAC